MADSIDTAKLVDRVSALVEAAKAAGASAADAVAVRGRSTAVSVRLGKVESTNASESDDIALRVFVGNRVASVSATPASDPRELAERAVAMARVSPEDPFQGLADPAMLARTIEDLDLFDPTDVSAERLKDDALAAEAAALAVPGVTNTAGAGASAGMGGIVLATSDGFVGNYMGTRFGCSVSAIAGEGTGMERDYDYSSRLHFADLDSADAIGRSAGERAVRRLKPRKAATGPVTVIFDPRVARGIAGPFGRRNQRRRGGPQDQLPARQDGPAGRLRRYHGHRRAAPPARSGLAPVRRRRHRRRALGDGRSGGAASLVPLDVRCTRTRG